jgi:ribose transport system permease protein
MSISGAPLDVSSEGRAKALAARVRGASLATSMPYVYVVVLGFVIYLLSPEIINGPGAIDVRFSAAVPLALVAFGQTLTMFTRGIDLAVGGLISTVTAILATTAASSWGTLILLLIALIALGSVAGLLNGVVIAVTG